MSDTPQGEGWWQASDGRWYPPQDRPPPPPPPSGPAQPPTAQVPGGPPPPASGPPAAGGGGKRRGWGFALLGSVVVLALVAGAFVAYSVLFDDAAAAEVALEPIGAARADAFTESVAPEPGGSLLDYAAGGAHVADDPEPVRTLPAGYRAFDGAVPGVYGGTLSEAACDPDQLIAFLGAEPEKAAAWAEVLGIDPGGIPAYVAALTPVNLDADARVVNHGFRDGEAVAREAVLQRGSAVLVDERGVPRVDCYAGSPLREAAVAEEPEAFSGERWETFAPERVIVVLPSADALEQFELVDIDTGELFTRPAGTRGEADRPGTVELADGQRIELDTEYDDVLLEGRTEARYLLDAPDGAVLTFSVENRRDSERSLNMEVVSRGERFGRVLGVNPGASEEIPVALDHAGGGEFELLFAGGPAAYTFEVTLGRQDDAGQGGDAGDSFESAFEVTAGSAVEGQLAGRDSRDVYRLEVAPGTELRVSAENRRGSPGPVNFEIRLGDERLLRELGVGPGGDWEQTLLLNGDERGVLEIIAERGPADYALSVEFVAQRDAGEDGDAGDERADTRAITTGEELAGQVGERDPADWYVFDAPGASVEVEVTNDIRSPGPLNVEVENLDGERVARELGIAPGATATLEFEALADEQFRVFFERGRADYRFEVRGLTLG